MVARRKARERNFTERIARELFRNRALANRIFSLSLSLSLSLFLLSLSKRVELQNVGDLRGEKKNSSLHFSFEFSPERSSLTRRRHDRRENLTECEFPIRDTIRHFSEIRNESDFICVFANKRNEL